MEFNVLEINTNFYPTQQIGTSSIATGSSNSNFGYAVALSADGTILAVGSPGLSSNNGGVYIYQTTESSLILLTLIVATSSSLTTPQQGTSVSISGNGTIVAFGGPVNNYDGVVNNRYSVGLFRLWKFLVIDVRRCVIPGNLQVDRLEQVLVYRQMELH